MGVFSYTHEGYDGHVITIEVDVRNGIPNTMIVGLAGHAIQEARERVRISLRNSGFRYPDRRVVINLSPASLPKSGTAFDLAIAYALLAHTAQVTSLASNVMLLGELHLDGAVAAIPGVISAIDEGVRNGITLFVVPRQNYHEAKLLGKGRVVALAHLNELQNKLPHDVSIAAAAQQTAPDLALNSAFSPPSVSPEIEYVCSHTQLKRVMEVAVAGHHHCLFVGPPGSGKTISARAMRELIAPLTPAEAVEVTRISSIAGTLNGGSALISRAPFRAPHHSISYVGMLGGGSPVRPGEIALAHNGILLLDEVLEFRRDVLQGLRQPLEEREIRISRAQRMIRFPSDFLLVMTANICPCGNFGKQSGACFCKLEEIRRYWKRMGGAFLDRIPLRCTLTVEHTPSSPPPSSDAAESVPRITKRIRNAVTLQCNRYRDDTTRRNGQLRAEKIAQHCALSADQHALLHAYASTHALSHRAIHATQTVARTIADLDGADSISDAHLQESIALRSMSRNTSDSHATDLLTSFLG